MRSVTVKSLFLALQFVFLAVTVYMTLAAELSSQLILAALVLNVLSILFTYLAFVTDNRFLKVYTFSFFFWYILRVPALLVTPENHYFIGWPTWVLSSFTQDDLEESVIVLVFYHFFTGLVIALIGSFLRPSDIRPSRTFGTLGKSDASSLFGSLFSWFAILAIYQLVHNVVLQLGRNPTAGTIAGYLNLFLAKDLVIFLLFFLGLMHYQSFNPGTRKKFWGFVILFAVGALSGGNRGGMIGMLFTAAVYFLVGYPNFVIRFNRSTVAYSLIMVFISIAMLYAGFIYRPLYRDTTGSELSAGAFIEAARNNPLSWQDWYKWASLRQSQFDIFSMTVVRDDSRFEHMISFSNGLKMLANWTVPGDLFNYGLYRLEPAARAISLDYAARGNLDAFHTDQLGLFATGVAYFGRYPGIAFVLGIVIVWIAAVAAISKAVPARYRDLWCVLIYWFFYMVFSSSGIEGIIFYYVTSLQQLAMFLIYQKLFLRYHLKPVYSPRAQAV